MSEGKPNIGALILERVSSRSAAQVEEARVAGFPGYPVTMDRRVVGMLVTFEAQAMAFSDQMALLWLAVGEARGFTPDGTAVWVQSMLGKHGG